MSGGAGDDAAGVDDCLGKTREKKTMMKWG